jgi:hypothetical protein
LNGSLFVHAKYSRVLGWRHVQANNVRRFGFEIRIIAGHVALQSMRSDIGLGENPLPRIFTDPKAAC